jgi:MYXO-CTERM domain-containing protein
MTTSTCTTPDRRHPAEEEREMLRLPAVAALFAATLFATAAQAANPPTPSGAHPRLFMSSANVTAFAANVAKKGTAAASMVANCQAAIDKPSDYTMRGGADGDAWPGTALACAFAYSATQQSKYLAPALKYWKAALEDDQNIGDALGCTAANDKADWTKWNGSTAAPPIILTVTHDTGYPIRWYGPDIALVYDWLYNATGVDDALRTQTRACLGAWIDYYTARGYHNDEAGANYNAGYVIGKTLAAIAIGNDGGADGHLWTETLNDVFAKLLVGQGLVGSATGVGTAAGVMLGGDWGEGWQYGPLSVAEYAAATRAVEEQGAAMPEMDAWVNSLIVRYIHGTVPTLDGQYTGDGDFDSGSVFQDPTANQLDAVLLGPSSDQAAAWAAYLKQQQKPSGSTYFWNVLGEIRSVTPQDYRAQTPAAPLWYLARGTRTMYVRTGWDASAFWAVFTSPPAVNSDHQHFGAGHFVFNRGGDGLIIDSSNYGEPDTHETNAVTVDSAGLQGDYAQSQTSWSVAELLWARGTNDAVFAARSDFARAFDFNGNKSDIPYAHREWVFLPEGEMVTIDRVQTAGTTKNMYVNFHANTAGTLKLSGAVAAGKVGGSALAIHAVTLSGGTPSIHQPTNGSCTLSCSYPCGACDAARFAVDEYSVAVPGPQALAIHVFDGLGSTEAQASVGSLNDDNFDPAPKQNAGVVGAAVYRAMKQSYVVASSAAKGAAGATMTYGVPGGSAGRHIVFDAPEASDGSSAVTASASSGRCVLTITAGGGGGIAGHPLMFQVGAASAGCTVSADTDVPPGTPPPGGGVPPTTGTGGSIGSGAGGTSGSGTGGTSSSGAAGSTGTGTGGASSTGLGGSTGGTTHQQNAVGGGCSCGIADGGHSAFALLAMAALALLSRRRRIT